MQGLDPLGGSEEVLSKFLQLFFVLQVFDKDFVVDLIHDGVLNDLLYSFLLDYLA